MEGKHTVPLECKRTLGAPQLTSQLPCSSAETAGLFAFFWEADTTVILSIISPLQLNGICVTINQHTRRAGEDRLWLRQNTRKLRDSCNQCSRIYLHTRPLAVSKGLRSFWVIWGCTTTSKACLTVTFTTSESQQNPSTMAANFLASREGDEMLHVWSLHTEAS